jgi:gas vesicle protein
VDIGTVISIGIAFLAVIVAFWQGFLSKAQLEEAKRTKTETDKILTEISQKAEHIQSIADETRKDVKDQISRLIEKQDENFKLVLNAPNNKNQSDLLQALVPKLMENPQIFQTLIELGQKKS